MRDIRSFIAFMLTHDVSCEEISQTELLKDTNPEKILAILLFQYHQSYFEDSGNKDRLIKLLRETDVGEVAIPHLDRELFLVIIIQKTMLYLEKENLIY